MEYLYSLYAGYRRGKIIYPQFENFFNVSLTFWLSTFILSTFFSFYFYTFPVPSLSTNFRDVTFYYFYRLCSQLIMIVQSKFTEIFVDVFAKV